MRRLDYRTQGEPLESTAMVQARGGAMGLGRGANLRDAQEVRSVGSDELKEGMEGSRTAPGHGLMQSAAGGLSVKYQV